MILMNNTDATITYPQRISVDYLDRCPEDDARLADLIKSPLGVQARAFAHEQHDSTEIELWSLDSQLRIQFIDKLRALVN